MNSNDSLFQMSGSPHRLAPPPPTQSTSTSSVGGGADSRGVAVPAPYVYSTPPPPHRPHGSGGTGHHPSAHVSPHGHTQQRPPSGRGANPSEGHQPHHPPTQQYYQSHRNPSIMSGSQGGPLAGPPPPSSSKQPHSTAAADGGGGAAAAPGGRYGPAHPRAGHSGAGDPGVDTYSHHHQPQARDGYGGATTGPSTGASQPKRPRLLPHPPAPQRSRPAVPVSGSQSSHSLHHSQPRSGLESRYGYPGEIDPRHSLPGAPSGPAASLGGAGVPTGSVHPSQPHPMGVSPVGGAGGSGRHRGHLMHHHPIPQPAPSAPSASGPVTSSATPGGSGGQEGRYPASTGVGGVGATHGPSDQSQQGCTQPLRVQVGLSLPSGGASDKNEGGYNPQVEAISPTLSTTEDTKSELVSNISRLDKEITNVASEINRLKRKQEKLEKEAQCPRLDGTAQEETVGDSDSQETSLAERIYTKNMAKATDPTGLGVCLPSPMGASCHPEDCAMYVANNRSFQQKSPFLQKAIRKQKMELVQKNKDLGQQYEEHSQAWIKKMETKNIRKKAKDQKMREFFEKVFPELKKSREDKERLQRAGTRPGGARTEAELEQICDGLQEQEEEERRMRSYAIMPPPLLDRRAEEEGLHRFSSTNGRVADPHGEHTAIRDQAQASWTEAEKQTFRERYNQYPKNFCMIAAGLEKKSAMDSVLHYYTTKKQVNYKLSLTKKTVRPPKKSKQPKVPRVEDKEVKMEDDTEGDNEEEARVTRSAAEAQEQGGAHQCCTCQSPLEHYGKSQPLSESGCEMYGVSLSSWRPHMRVCHTCRANRRRCPIPTCQTPSSKVRRLRPLPAMWHELPAGPKEAIAKELSIPEEMSKCCASCFNKIVRLMGSTPSGTSEQLVDEEADDGTDTPTAQWSNEDIDAFIQGLKAHGTDWALLSGTLPSKSDADCKAFYQTNCKKLGLDTIIKEHTETSAQSKEGTQAPPTGGQGQEVTSGPANPTSGADGSSTGNESDKRAGSQQQEDVPHGNKHRMSPSVGTEELDANPAKMAKKDPSSEGVPRSGAPSLGPSGGGTGSTPSGGATSGHVTTSILDMVDLTRSEMATLSRSNIVTTDALGGHDRKRGDMNHSMGSLGDRGRLGNDDGDSSATLSADEDTQGDGRMDHTGSREPTGGTDGTANLTAPTSNPHRDTAPAIRWGDPPRKRRGGGASVTEIITYAIEDALISDSNDSGKDSRPLLGPIAEPPRGGGPPTVPHLADFKGKHEAAGGSAEGSGGAGTTAATREPARTLGSSDGGGGDRRAWQAHAMVAMEMGSGRGRNTPDLAMRSSYMGDPRDFGRQPTGVHPAVGGGPGLSGVGGGGPGGGPRQPPPAHSRPTPGVHPREMPRPGAMPAPSLDQHPSAREGMHPGASSRGDKPNISLEQYEGMGSRGSPYRMDMGGYGKGGSVGQAGMPQLPQRSPRDTSGPPPLVSSQGPSKGAPSGSTPYYKDMSAGGGGSITQGTARSFHSPGALSGTSTPRFEGGSISKGTPRVESQGVAPGGSLRRPTPTPPQHNAPAAAVPPVSVKTEPGKHPGISTLAAIVYAQQQQLQEALIASGGMVDRVASQQGVDAYHSQMEQYMKYMRELCPSTRAPGPSSEDLLLFLQRQEMMAAAGGVTGGGPLSGPPGAGGLGAQKVGSSPHPHQLAGGATAAELAMFNPLMAATLEAAQQQQVGRAGPPGAVPNLLLHGMLPGAYPPSMMAMAAAGGAGYLGDQRLLTTTAAGSLPPRGLEAGGGGERDREGWPKYTAPSVGEGAPLVTSGGAAAKSHDLHGGIPLAMAGPTGPLLYGRKDGVGDPPSIEPAYRAGSKGGGAQGGEPSTMYQKDLAALAAGCYSAGHSTSSAPAASTAGPSANASSSRMSILEQDGQLFDNTTFRRALNQDSVPAAGAGGDQGRRGSVGSGTAAHRRTASEAPPLRASRANGSEGPQGHARSSSAVGRMPPNGGGQRSSPRPLSRQHQMDHHKPSQNPSTGSGGHHGPSDLTKRHLGSQPDSEGSPAAALHNQSDLGSRGQQKDPADGSDPDGHEEGQVAKEDAHPVGQGTPSNGKVDATSLLSTSFEKDKPTPALSGSKGSPVTCGNFIDLIIMQKVSGAAQQEESTPTSVIVPPANKKLRSLAAPSANAGQSSSPVTVSDSASNASASPPCGSIATSGARTLRECIDDTIAKDYGFAMVTSATGGQTTQVSSEDAAGRPQVRAAVGGISSGSPVYPPGKRLSLTTGDCPSPGERTPANTKAKATDPSVTSPLAAKLLMEGPGAGSSSVAKSEKSELARTHQGISTLLKSGGPPPSKPSSAYMNNMSPIDFMNHTIANAIRGGVGGPPTGPGEDAPSSSAYALLSAATSGGPRGVKPTLSSPPVTSPSAAGGARREGPPLKGSAGSGPPLSAKAPTADKAPDVKVTQHGGPGAKVATRAPSAGPTGSVSTSSGVKATGGGGPVGRSSTPDRPQSSAPHHAKIWQPPLFAGASQHPTPGASGSSQGSEGPSPLAAVRPRSHSPSAPSISSGRPTLPKSVVSMSSAGASGPPANRPSPTNPGVAHTRGTGGPRQSPRPSHHHPGGGPSRSNPAVGADPYMAYPPSSAAMASLFSGRLPPCADSAAAHMGGLPASFFQQPGPGDKAEASHAGVFQSAAFLNAMAAMSGASPKLPAPGGAPMGALLPPSIYGAPPGMVPTSAHSMKGSPGAPLYGGANPPPCRSSAASTPGQPLYGSPSLGVSAGGRGSRPSGGMKRASPCPSAGEDAYKRSRMGEDLRGRSPKPPPHSRQAPPQPSHMHSLSAAYQLSTPAVSIKAEPQALPALPAQSMASLTPSLMAASLAAQQQRQPYGSAVPHSAAAAAAAAGLLPAHLMPPMMPSGPLPFPAGLLAGDPHAVATALSRGVPFPPAPRAAAPGPLGSFPGAPAATGDSMYSDISDSD